MGMRIVLVEIGIGRIGWGELEAYQLEVLVEGQRYCHRWPLSRRLVTPQLSAEMRKWIRETFVVGSVADIRVEFRSADGCGARPIDSDTFSVLFGEVKAGINGLFLAKALS